jgi:hypothetical protein
LRLAGAWGRPPQAHHPLSGLEALKLIREHLKARRLADLWMLEYLQGPQGCSAAVGSRDRSPGLLRLPAAHSKLHSTNPLERVNREISRRTDVVGVFPNDAALLRLACSLLIEQNDEWLVSRCYLSEASMAESSTHPSDSKGPKLVNTHRVIAVTARDLLTVC